jgi:hypothetical protein
MRSRFSLSLLLDAVRLIYETLSRRLCTEAAYVLGRLCTERHPNSQMYELARAPMSPSGRVKQVDIERVPCGPRLRSARAVA